MKGPLIGKHFMSLNLTELLLSESVLCDALSKKGPLILKLQAPITSYLLYRILDYF